jgi:hypothetical protein
MELLGSCGEIFKLGYDSLLPHSCQIIHNHPVISYLTLRKLHNVQTMGKQTNKDTEHVEMNTPFWSTYILQMGSTRF